MAECPLNGAFSTLSWLVAGPYSPFTAGPPAGVSVVPLSVVDSNLTASAGTPDLFEPGAIPLWLIERLRGGGKRQPPPAVAHGLFAGGAYFQGGARKAEGADDPQSPSDATPLSALGPTLTLRLTQRLELKLQLVLQLKLEQNCDRGAVLGDLFDDAWSAEHVPSEIIEVNDLLSGMAREQDVELYLSHASRVLDTIQKIMSPEFRMMAICRLAEELSKHKELAQNVEELFSAHFTANFSAAHRLVQPALSLAVAVSQMKSGMNPKTARGLLQRAMAIAKSEQVGLRGRDARNLEFLLARLPIDLDDLETMKGLADSLVETELWAPSPADVMAMEEQRRANRSVEEEAEEALPVAPVESQAPALTEEQAEFLYSSFIHHAMRRMAETQGVQNIAVFATLLELATSDAWEETAVTAYELLSAHEPYRAQLTGALANFTSPYYREKARLMLVRAQGGETARIEEALRALLGEERGLSGIRRQHEEVFLGSLRLPAGGEVAVEGGVEALSDPDVYTTAGIILWARGCVDAMRGAGATQAGADVGVMQAGAGARQDPDDDIDADDTPPAEDADEEAEIKKQAREDRTGELYLIIARNFLQDKSGSADAWIAALKLVADSGSPQAIAEFIRTLPSPIDESVRAESQRVVGEKLAGKRFYQALAGLKMTGEDQGQIAGARTRFLTAAREDEEIPNARAIEVLARMTGEPDISPDFANKLLKVARLRAALYKEKLEEITLPAGYVDGNEDSLEPADAKIVAEYKLMQRLYLQSQAHILAGIPFNPGKEGVIVRRIERLKDPFAIALACGMRARQLAAGGNGPERTRSAVELMDMAVSTLPNIDGFGLCMALAFDLSEAILGNNIYRGLVGKFKEMVGERFAVSEFERRASRNGRAVQDGWFGPERMKAVSGGGIGAAENLGRILTAKQLKKLWEAKDITDERKLDLLYGKLKSGPYQGAFDLLRPMIGREEGNGASPLLDKIYGILGFLCSYHGDKKAVDYVHDRTSRFIDGVKARQSAGGMSQEERGWLKLATGLGQGASFVPLMYSTGLTIEDRLWLLEYLGAKGLVDSELLNVYHMLEDRGAGHVFFELIEEVTKAVPGIKITQGVVDMILNNPDVKAGRKTVRDVVSDWVEMWMDYHKLETPEERIHALAENDLLLQIYYVQESAKLDFGGQVFSIERFREKVKQIDGLKPLVKYDHASMQRYEEALERANPTMRNERDESLARITAAELEDEDREFMLGLARSTGPLTEDEIQRMNSIGKENEIKHPESLLPPNRRRIYRLYFGMPPIAGRIGENGSAFVRDVRPSAKAGAREPDSPADTFYDRFADVVSLLSADRTIKLIDALLDPAEGVACKVEDFKVRRASLIDLSLTVEELEKKARRLHADILMYTDALTIHKARARSMAEAKKGLDEAVMSRLLSAGSHFIATDYLFRRSARMRAKAGEKSVCELRPELREFNLMTPKITDEKKAVAARLGFADGWEGNAGQKAIVEVEMLAEFAGLNEQLKGLYFGGIREEMQRSAEAEAEIFREAMSPAGRYSLGRLRIRHVAKTDIYTWMRIGDFRPCCIATDSTLDYWWPTVPYYLLDRMTHGLVIEDPDTQRAVGHMIHHMGLEGTADEDPAMFLNALYLRAQYRGAAQDSAALDVMNEYARSAGTEVVRHGIHLGHDLTTRPPTGFYPSDKDVITRLQTVVDNSGKPVQMYGDLQIPLDGGNKPHSGVAHYRHRVE